MESLHVLGSAAQGAFFYGIVPLAVIAGLCGLGGLIVGRNKSLAATALFFGLVGASLGLLLGSSREPAVKAYLPALITLLGGVILYTLPRETTMQSLFAASGDQKPDPRFVRSFVIAAVSALILSSTVGTNVGAAIRAASEDADRQYDKWLKFYQAVQLPIEKQLLEAALGFDSAPAN